MLADQSGHEISFVSGRGTLPAGTSTVPLDFDGNLLPRPPAAPTWSRMPLYRAPAIRLLRERRFRHEPFQASQFTYVPEDFTVAVQISERSELSLVNGSQRVHRIRYTDGSVEPTQRPRTAMAHNRGLPLQPAEAIGLQQGD